MKALSNASMKSSLLQRHHQINHPEKKDRDPNYFKRLGESVKKQQDSPGSNISNLLGC